MTVEEINQWAKSNGFARKELADKLGISKSSLDHGFAKGEFSPKIQAALELLISASQRPQGRFTPDEWRLIERARQIEGFQDTEDYHRHVMVAHARAVLAQRSLRVAEEHGQYGKEKPEG